MPRCSSRSLKNSRSREERLDQLAISLGFSFSRPELLAQALVHSSYANEHPKAGISHNERLEFLGDAVLDLVVSDWLYCLTPAMDEGAMTRARASVVCERSLANAAQAIHLGEYLLLSCGERGADRLLRPSILADAFEAVAGAIYLDGGLVAVRQFAERTLNEAVKQVQQGFLLRDYKSQLQEELQKEGPRSIVYELVHESGPAHNKLFEVAVLVEDELLGRGVGSTKKAAEQQAAMAGLEKIRAASDGVNEADR